MVADHRISRVTDHRMKLFDSTRCAHGAGM
jgi:hypothetical protein